MKLVKPEPDLEARIDVFALPVLAAADIFPMMPDDELEELASDIKENGLIEPLVVADVQTSDGEVVKVLIDGRNRRSACKIAGVDPAIRHLNGEDPNAYVLSANIHRRHMTKGQRAIAVAMIYPESSARGRGKKSAATKCAETAGFSDRRLQEARTVLLYSSSLAESVLAGVKPLDTAYKEAQAARQAAMGETACLDRLRGEAPDLADRVIEEQISLAEAATLAAARAEDRARKVKRAKEAAANMWHEMSSILGAVETGEELGAPYVLPDDHLDIAQSVIKRATDLFHRSHK